MTLTQIEVDDEALAEAMRVPGTRTKEETVGLALRELVARHQRTAGLEQYARLAADWDYEDWKRRRLQTKLARDPPPA